MNEVCAYIVNHFQDKSVEYFSMSDSREFYRDNGLQIKYVVDNLTATISSKLEITECKLEEFDVYINFVYDGYKGCVYTYQDSRGYDYWVVDFSNLD